MGDLAIATKRLRGSDQKIDPGKVRARLRRLHKDELLSLADRAIDLLPVNQLSTLIEPEIDPQSVRPDGSSTEALALSVEAFFDASIRGEYYEDFAVDSRNFTLLSPGTQSWIAEYERLLARCVATAREGRVEARGSFEMLFDLLRRLDQGDDTIVFFADEGGSWQVGVDWRPVFSAYFECLAHTAAPEEYATVVLALIDEFEAYKRDEHLRAARACATSAQKRTLRGR